MNISPMSLCAKGPLAPWCLHPSFRRLHYSCAATITSLTPDGLGNEVSRRPLHTNELCKRESGKTKGILMARIVPQRIERSRFVAEIVSIARQNARESRPRSLRDTYLDVSGFFESPATVDSRDDFCVPLHSSFFRVRMASSLAQS